MFFCIFFTIVVLENTDCFIKFLITQFLSQHSQASQLFFSVRYVSLIFFLYIYIYLGFDVVLCLLGWRPCLGLYGRWLKILSGPKNFSTQPI